MQHPVSGCMCHRCLVRILSVRLQVSLQGSGEPQLLQSQPLLHLMGTRHFQYSVGTHEIRCLEKFDESILEHFLDQAAALLMHH